MPVLYMLYRVSFRNFFKGGGGGEDLSWYETTSRWVWSTCKFCDPPGHLDFKASEDGVKDGVKWGVLPVFNSQIPFTLIMLHMGGGTSPFCTHPLVLHMYNVHVCTLYVSSC